MRAEGDSYNVKSLLHSIKLSDFLGSERIQLCELLFWSGCIFSFSKGSLHCYIKTTKMGFSNSFFKAQFLIVKCSNVLLGLKHIKLQQKRKRGLWN